jgi:hypothetical protein
MINVALMNQSKKVTTAQTKILAAGLTVYARPISPEWFAADVKVTAYLATDLIPRDAWPFYICDKLPAGSPPRAYGYHDYVDGKPVAWISTALTMPLASSSPFGLIQSATPAIPPFIDVDGKLNPGLPAQPERLFSGSLCEVLSHELAEALVDPTINRYADNGQGQMLLMEVGDIADNLRYTVTVVTGVLRKKVRMIVQGWAKRSAYVVGAKPPYSYPDGISAPFVLNTAEGCYGWQVLVTGAGAGVGFDRLGGETG